MKMMILMIQMILSLVPWTPPPNETNFQFAYKQVLAHEGNWVNDPDDKGGETYRGITKTYNPHWYGWRYVDATLDKKRYQNIEAANYWAQDYYLDLWVKEGWDVIEDKHVAAYLFDYRINAYTGVKEIKKALYKLNLTLPIDNKFKPTDAHLINLLKPKDVLYVVHKTRTSHYYRIVRNNPTQKKFLKHWLHRTKLKPMR